MENIAGGTIPGAQANQPARFEVYDRAFYEDRRSGGAADLPHDIGRDDGGSRFLRENAKVGAALEFCDNAGTDVGIETGHDYGITASLVGDVRSTNAAPMTITPRHAAARAACSRST